MKIEAEAKLLTIYIGENDHFRHRPLYKVIVEKLKEQGLKGATVLRGIEGYGRKSRIHTASILRLSEDLPIVIEVIDEEERIKSILPMIEETVTEGLVTLTDVDIIAYRPEEGTEG